MKFSILIVDDSLPMRGVLKKTLRAAGYGTGKFIEADNGESALAAMAQHHVDLVVTDFNMPVMNGLEMIRRMQARPETSRIPVVVISTEGSRDKIQEFIDQGAARYIKKPFSPEQIRDLLVDLVGEPSDENPIDDPGDQFDF